MKNRSGDGSRYSNMDELTMFGFAVNLGGRHSPSGTKVVGIDGVLREVDAGDYDQAFPRSDAEDLSRGARFVPGNVTLARRRGEKVEFVAACSRNCWHWRFEDGRREYHWCPITETVIGERNGKVGAPRPWGGTQFEGGAGPCPDCGNPHTYGGDVDKDGKAVGR